MDELEASAMNKSANVNATNTNLSQLGFTCLDDESDESDDDDCIIDEGASEQQPEPSKKSDSVVYDSSESLASLDMNSPASSPNKATTYRQAEIDTESDCEMLPPTRPASVKKSKKIESDVEIDEEMEENNDTTTTTKNAEQAAAEIPEEKKYDFIPTDKLDENTGHVTTVTTRIPKLEYYEKNNWIFNDINDCSPHYHRHDYQHSERMFYTFSNQFGLKAFRPQQFEAINEALNGDNCFVLMPTGGGKSLCYQLPAELGEGVTFVVSPLKSLIIDQVDKLNSLNIKAAHLLGEGDAGDRDESDSNSASVYRDLTKENPTFKLVYITPEKLNASSRFKQIIQNVYGRGKLTRLVIDEAHCVSTWGHDFRKDYTQLGKLRLDLFPS